MAGAIRQPIDLAPLSAYVEKNVGDIKLPISLKQVPLRALLGGGALLTDVCLSLALDSRILPISLAQPMEANMYYERSHRASCFPRQLTRSNASSASSTP